MALVVRFAGGDVVEHWEQMKIGRHGCLTLAD
jgi:hypothetical protein